MKLKEIYGDLYGTLLTEQTVPQVGQYYCNNSPSQGNSCMLVTTAGNGGGNGFIPGQPAQIEISLVLGYTVPFYNTLQDCEATCSNHYPFNCWNFNNGNSSPNVSFPHITTAQKNDFCIQCQNDVAGSLIKSHPYCWCLDNGTGNHPNPPASMWSGPNYVYTCPPPSNQWYCPSEIDMAMNTVNSCCVQGIPPTANHQVFATQQDCQNATSCCNIGNQAGTMNPCCGGVEQGDPCTYNSWNNYYSPQNRIDYCNTYGTNPLGMYYYPYGPCCGGCTDPLAINYNPTAVIDDGSCKYGHRPEYGCLDTVASNYNTCCDTSGNPIPNCTPDTHMDECCRYIHEPDHKGCMDSTALNYMTCCDPTIPGCTPTLPVPECCKYDRVTEDKGCLDPNALNYNECCDGDPNCTVVGSNQECCKYEEDPDEKGCMDPSAINYMDCCPQSNYPGCVATLPYDCCKYEGGETKHCTCCKKTENGTIAGFSITTAIPVGDSCSQFNNSQPGLYGCVDSTTWSLVKCKTQIGPPHIMTGDLDLSEEIKRYKQLL